MVRRDTADIAADMMQDISAAEKMGEYFFGIFMDIFLMLPIKTERTKFYKRLNFNKLSIGLELLTF